MLRFQADLHKVYIDDEHYNAGHGYAYTKYNVHPSDGAVVIVRPDQCEWFYRSAVIGFEGNVLMGIDVAKKTTMGDFEGIERFFGGFLFEV
jgi:phenol 2-monooxygenase